MRSVLFVVCVAFAGCAGAHGTGGTTWSADISPAVSGEENTVAIYDPSATATALRATLHMTDMEMPPQRITLARTGDHRYVAEHVHFSMSGGWELDASSHRVRVQVR